MMSKYEFVYLLCSGFKWKWQIEEIEESNIDKVTDVLKIVKYKNSIHV